MIALLPNSTKLVVAVLTLGFAVGVCSPARADVASWMYVGGGAASVESDDTSASTRSLMQLDAGFGSTPHASLIFGGIFRTLTHFGGGTDLVLAQRTATGGFCRGDWGVALDLGGVQRWWGQDSSGLIGTLTAGGPWGLQLSLLASTGSNGGQMMGLSLGVDWARATAHRTTGTRWWPNRVLPVNAER